MSFQNFPIVTKILGLLVALGLVAAGGAVLAGRTLTTVSGSYSTLIDGPGKVAAHFAQADRAIVFIERSILQTIWSVTPKDNAKYAGETRTGVGRFRESLDKAQAAEPARTAEIQAYRKRFDQTVDGSCATTLEMAKEATSTDDNAAAMRELNARCGPDLSRLAGEISAYATTLSDHMDKQAGELAVTAERAILINYAMILGGLAIVLAFAALLTRSTIVAPIRALVAAMERMSKGELHLTIANTGRKDEIGVMANTVEVFRKGLAEAEDMRREQEQAQVDRANRLAARSAAADRFIERMTEISGAFVQASDEISGAAKNLSATAEETSRQAQAVSGAAEEASANVNTVAASTEELAASVQEVAGQVGKAAAVANNAAGEATNTQTEIRSLTQAVQTIGEVVELINTIAAQTNLLALNATIEAARAGEAGRGFAVVASEVKELAGQTAKATEVIGGKIAEIQNATAKTVGSIESIVGIVEDIRSISSAVAGGVEEQSAATQEIASNTQRAARGASEVTGNIAGVGRAAEMTGSAATQLMGLSGDLTQRSADLQREVAEFVKSLRAA